jgi:ABC-2 type transport system permease protein
MREIWLVFKHEMRTTLGRRSFQVAVFGFPMLALRIFSIVHLYRNLTPPSLTENAERSPLEFRNGAARKPAGFVDLSNTIKAIPASIQPSELIGFPTEAAAGSALRSGQIDLYYLIPENYLATGDIIVNTREPLLESAVPHTSMLERLIAVNLLQGNERLASQFKDPIKSETLSSDVPGGTESQYLVAFFLPFGVTIFFYITILMSSSLLLGSLTVEKENRVLEILLTSIAPHRLLSGKILGLGLTGLIQTAIWLGTSILILRWGGQSLQIPLEAQLTPAFFALGVLFYLLGYGLYVCLMASLGVLVNNLREASQLSIILLMPMMIPVLTITVMISAPDSPFVIGLSLFPLTSPVAMMSRLVITRVPAWQVLSAVILLAASILVVLKVVAGLFRTQTLLAGKPLSARRIYEVIRGGE